jgi:hypothetical protein
VPINNIATPLSGKIKGFLYKGMVINDVDIKSEKLKLHNRRNYSFIFSSSENLK